MSIGVDTPSNRPTGETVVAGGVAVYRDAVSQLLRLPAVTTEAVGDASLVVLCPNGDGPAEVELLVRQPGRRVVVVGVTGAKALKCLMAGAVGVLGPEASADDLREAVVRAALGKATFSSSICSLVFDQIRQDVRGEHRLTRRELETAKLLGERFSNKEIAARLCITESTVKKHVRSIGQKLSLRGRYAIGEWARKQPGF